jgi:hypothetical protein
MVLLHYDTLRDHVQRYIWTLAFAQRMFRYPASVLVGAYKSGFQARQLYIDIRDHVL